MKTKNIYQLIAVTVILFLSACEDNNSGVDDNTSNLTGNTFIADYSIAKESVLRSIPQNYINTARQTLHVAYQHTSHGTHVSYGLFGLQDFEAGDDVLFGITNNDPTLDKLDFRDNSMAGYAEEGASAADLSGNETAFIQATRNFLDDPDNAEINVVMWSWCDISGHDVAANYLPGMQTLINEYSAGGTKIGTGTGQRSVAVTFVFMTGHANPGSNVGEGNPRDQATLITDYCKENRLLCLDYYSIDTHCMFDNYWEDAGDNGNSEDYGGNFYIDFQIEGTLGQDYYLNKNAPGGSVTCGDHNTQHITANRKAFAMWWILARIAGWNGQ